MWRVQGSSEAIKITNSTVYMDFFFFIWALWSTNSGRRYKLVIHFCAISVSKLSKDVTVEASLFNFSGLSFSINRDVWLLFYF